MIKGLTGSSNVIVNGGSTSFPYVPYNSNNPIQGMLRLNGQDLQVFDGSAWVNLGSSYASVDLSADAQSLLQWAREQRDKQRKREQLIDTNPALRKAFEAIQRAEANFNLIEKFVENDNADSEVQSSP